MNSNRRATVVTAVALSLTGCTSGGPVQEPNPSPTLSPSSSTTRSLSWQDEFTGPVGAFPDPGTWTAEYGGGGWGSWELQTYTDSPENVALDGDGHLVITARQERPGDDASWTSARITTFGKKTSLYGRIEIRAKLPSGQGIWPAGWTLGQNIEEVGWPASGEIDLIESVGDGTEGLQTAHGARSDGSRWLTTLRAPQQSSLAEGFHTYSVEWTTDRLVFAIDDQVTGEIVRADLGADQIWPFDEPQYLLLNVAVGGDLPGAPDETTPTTASMLVDWVRVYR